jgi:hypothetical protein
VGSGALAKKFPVQGSPYRLGTVAAPPSLVAGVFAFGMVAGIDGQHRLSRLQRDCALFTEVEQNFGGDCTVTVQFCPKLFARSDKSFMVNDFFMVEAAGVERFFDLLSSITYAFSIAYKSAKMPKMPFSWYSFGTVFG